MAKVTLKLSDLACPDCARKIGETLERHNGVQSAKVLFMSSQVKVDYDPQVVTVDELKSSVQKTGYKVLEVTQGV